MTYLHQDAHSKENRRNLRHNMTPQEIHLWSYLKGSNLGSKFQRQHGIGKYIVDFYCPSKKLIVEIDGIQHDDNNSKIYDNERTDYFESLEYRVLRFWNDEINRDIKVVLDRIERELQSYHPG